MMGTTSLLRIAETLLPGPPYARALPDAILLPIRDPLVPVLPPSAGRAGGTLPAQYR